MESNELVPQELQFARSRGRGWGVQCKRIKRNGERCKKWAILGGFVCQKHGGQLPVVRAAALSRIQSLVPAAVTALSESLNDDKKDEVRLRAARIILRMAGLGTGSIRTLESEQRALNAGQGAPLPNTDAEIDALLQTLQLEAGDESGSEAAEGPST